MKRLSVLLITLLFAACATTTQPVTEQTGWNADRVVSALDKSAKKIADSSNRYSIRLERISKLLKSVSSKEVYIDTKIDLFVLGSNLRVYSGLMDIMRDDELLALMAQEEGHNKLGHYRNLLDNVSEGYEAALDTPFSDTQNSAADAYALNFFIENKQEPQAVVNSAYKLAKIEEKISLLGADITVSPRVVNKSSRDRAKAVASMLQEAKQNPQYLAGQIQNEAPGTETTRQETISTPAVKKESLAPVKEAIMPKALKAPMEQFDEEQEDKIEAVKNTEEMIEETDEEVVPEKTEVKKVMQGTKSASIGMHKEVSIESSSDVEKGWYLQVSAEDNKQTAVSKVANLSSAQLRGAVQETNVSGKKYYRVLIGPYSSKAELAEAKKSSQVQADAFARYIE